MNETENYIIVSIGHTAAGKTSLLNYLSNKLNLSYIEEGQIKRDLLPAEYTSKDSLNEDLRDKAYKIAIERAILLLKEKRNIALDASFHRNYRRQWVYDLLVNNLDLKPIIIWLYVYCNNKYKVKIRINNRFNSNTKTAKNQADKFYIFEHIINTFDEVNLSSFPANYRSIILNVDTDENELSFNASNFCNEYNQPTFIKLINNLITVYLKNQKNK